MELTDTQIKIIEAAEVEFAKHGFEGASVRSITTRASVNIAAINYHFGSKEDLFKKMLLYRIEPINRQRLEMLDAAYAASNGEALEMLEVIEIIVRPLISSLIDNSDSEHHFMRAMGRGFTEELEFIKNFHKEILAEVLPRFSAAIEKSLGNCSSEQTLYTLHFLTCTMVGAMTQHGRLEAFSNGNPKLSNVKNMIDRLVRFIEGGIRSLDSFEKGE